MTAGGMTSEKYPIKGQKSFLFLAACLSHDRQGDLSPLTTGNGTEEKS